MYLHIGKDYIINNKDIVAIFNLLLDIFYIAQIYEVGV